MFVECDAGPRLVAVHAMHIGRVHWPKSNFNLFKARSRHFLCLTIFLIFGFASRFVAIGDFSELFLFLQVLPMVCTPRPVNALSFNSKEKKTKRRIRQ